LLGGAETKRINNVALKPFAFVLMPFDDQFSDIYKLGIQAAAKEANVVAERVDEQTFSETILERIYRQIRNADVVIADMTGRNSNVFYEVGYAHAIQKPCILLTRTAEDIPFDLKHHRHIIYGNSIDLLRRKLKAELEWHIVELEKSKHNAFTIELKSSEGSLTKDEYTSEASINFVIDIRNTSDTKTPDIDAIYFLIGKSWSVKQGGEVCPSREHADKKKQRIFVKSPVPRLSAGGWAQIQLEAYKQVWSKWSGEVAKDKYTYSGEVVLEIATSEGTYSESIHAKATCEEFPF
jgi:nucleoside 2-deoxyribosyltransferase